MYTGYESSQSTTNGTVLQVTEDLALPMYNRALNTSLNGVEN